MLDLNTYIVTFNCGREVIDTDFFAAHLFDGLKSRDAPPDLIVLCLQEVAPIAYSFLSASMITHYTSRFESAVTSALREDYGGAIAEDFLCMQLRNVGMTAIMVLARRDVQARFRRVDTAGVGVGLWEMGNKGAVGVRLWIDEEQGYDAIPITFVAAHLAPMEGSWQRRNQDWQTICQRLVFTPDEQFAVRAVRSSEDEPLLNKDEGLDQSHDREQGMFSPLSSLFFAGDLNYRTSDQQPRADDHKAWMSPHGKVADEFASMMEQDQLTRERGADRTLHLMEEANIKFPPTYKYSSLAQKQALKLATSPVPAESSLWAEHRIPSWCDRILFLGAAKQEVHSYTALPIQPTSDHRPVALSLTIPVRPVSDTDTKAPFRIDETWKTRRAAARQLELLVGVAAYLTLTPVGRAVLVGGVIGITGIVLATLASASG